MADLTGMTLKAALDGLKAKSFSAVELAKAHITAIEGARGLNAFVLETPDHALQGVGQLRQLVAGGTGLIGPGSGTHGQVTDVHQIAVHFSRHLRLFFSRAGDHQVAFMDLVNRVRDRLQRLACTLGQGQSRRCAS